MYITSKKFAVTEDSYFNISNGLDFQKIENQTYEEDNTVFSDLFNQLRILNPDIDAVQYIKEIIIQLIEKFSKGIMSMDFNMDTNNIFSITENNATEYLKNHGELKEPLLEYVNNIKKYLRKLGKDDDIHIMLQGSPEIQNFKLLVIYIRTEFSDLDEKLDLYDYIGDILNDTTKKIVDDKGDEMYDELAMVTYLLEEINA